MNERDDTVSKGNVLLMDDEVVILEVVGDILSMNGYEVGWARNGAEAVGLYEVAMQRGEPYDVVIMDLTIPGGGGARSAIAALLKTDPGAKAIALSGNPNDPVMTDYWKYGFKGALVKPCTRGRLVDEIRRVMGDAAA